MSAQHPPITYDEPAPDLARPRHTVTYDEGTAFMASIVGETIARVLAEGYDPDAASTTLQRAGFHAVESEYDAIDASTAWLVSVAEDAEPSDAVQRAAYDIEDLGRE